MFTTGANGKKLIGRRVEYRETATKTVGGVIRTFHNHLGRPRLGVKWDDGFFSFIHADHPLLKIKEV